MEARYLLVLRDGLTERCVVRAFMDKIYPGTTVRVDGNPWVVIRIHERAQMLPEALVVPAALSDR